MPYLTPDATPTARACRRLLIPDDTDWLGAFNGALLELTYVHNWEQFGAVTPEEAANESMNVINRMWDESCVSMIGSLILSAASSAPDGTLPCDGTTYLREDYPELYSVLLPAYIIDADHFMTPAPVSYVGLNYFIVTRN